MESTVFRCGRGQGVYLPEAVALPDEVTHVEIVVVGRTRIITPVGESWDRWFDEPCGRCEQVPDMRSCLSSGAMEQGSS